MTAADLAYNEAVRRCADCAESIAEAVAGGRRPSLETVADYRAARTAVTVSWAAMVSAEAGA